MLSHLSQIWPAVSRIAHENGVTHLGASDLRDEHADMFAEWIAAGHHAGMKYLEKNAAIRSDPEKRFPWAKSMIVILVPYASARPDADPDAISSHISRYALGDDYHEVLERILAKVEDAIQHAAQAGGADDRVKTWRYVDTGPLSDRAAAAQAGLGWIGRNAMLITQEHGSYFFIGTLVTSLENDIGSGLAADRCGTCTRCITACPTEAILPNRTVASELCISYATIEHRGPMPPAFAEKLQGNAFGCDICQEVCPWNGAPADAHPAFAAREEYRATPITDLLKFEQADFSTLFRKSAIKRAKLDGMKRNVSALSESGQ